MHRPRILFVEPQEDIDELTAKLKAVKSGSVALVIPHGAVILQSIISLKILRNNAEHAGKQILIITRDKNGRRFAEQLGIPAHTDLEHLEQLPIEKRLQEAREAETETKNGKRIFFKPFPAPHKRKPVNLEEKKREILELLSRPSKPLLFSIVAISLVLLLLVTTIALPGATIKINPQKKVIETTINVVLSSKKSENLTDSWRQQVITAIPVESVFERSMPFETVSKVFTGKRAEGRVTVINTLSEEVSLRPDTRFQTDKGIVLRSKEWVRVPGKAERSVAVYADDRDAYGDFIGARGNLEPLQTLSLPGLPSQTQRSLYAEVRTPLTGGESGYIAKVAENDLQIAQKKLEQTIVEQARVDSENFVRRKNLLENSDLVLVPGDQFMTTEILEIDLPEEMIGKEVSSFTVRSRMRVQMLAYSEKEMDSVLRGALSKRIDPDMELVSVEETGISPEVLSISPNHEQIKITVSARGIEAFVIEPRTAGGVKFVNRVKKAVLNKSTADAKKILQNFQEVSEVEISVWPPIFNRMPALPEKISVKLME